MAASLKAFLLALACALCLGESVAQGPSNLTISQASSTAKIQQQGAPSLSLQFVPSTVQLTGLVVVNVTTCGQGGLPAEVTLIGTNISTVPAVIDVRARALGSSIGNVSLTNLTLNFSPATFPLNPSNGSYVVVVSGGSAHVDTLNGTLTGNSFNRSDVSMLFTNQTQVVNGTFRSTSQGLQMRADSTIVIPLSELVTAAGYGGNSLVTSAVSGGSLQIPTTLVAVGTNSCRGGPTGSRRLSRT